MTRMMTRTTTWTLTLRALCCLLPVLAACGGGGGTPPVTAATIEVSPSAVGPLAPGVTALLSAIVRDAAGAALIGRPVTWSSASPSIAAVSATGVVTGVGEGTTTVSATADGRAGSASVTVRIPVASVSILPTTLSLLQGTTQTLVATPRDASGAPIPLRTVVWASTNPSIATVSPSGVVTGVAVGTAAITATSDGAVGAVPVSVTPVPVASVTVSPTTFSLLTNSTQTLTATPKDASGAALTGRAVLWTSSNASVATVSTSGVVTGVTAGSATIAAQVDGITGTSIGTITAVPIATISVTPSSASIVQGRTQQLVATSRDASGTLLTGRSIVWSTSNAAVATVNSTGTVTAVAAGTATITATAEGRSGTSVFTVRPLATEPAIVITSNPAGDTAQRIIVLTGQTATLQPALLVQNSTGGALPASSVTWTARDPSRATVSSTGLISGVRAGRTFIVAQSTANSTIADSVLVFVPQNSTGPLLRTASPSYRIAATDTFSIVIQLEIRDGKALSAADFEVAWPGASAAPFNPFNVTSVTPLRSGVVFSFSADATEVARVTWASTTPATGTIALVRLNCRVAMRNVTNQVLFTLNQLIASDLTDLTATASTFNPLVIIP